jgi:mRNA interferase RelE/StbE
LTARSPAKTGANAAAPYAVLLESSVERDLRRLDATTFRRIIVQIRKLATEPRPPGCRKLTGSDSDWRIRAGDYRVVYEIDDHAREVRIMRARHRREVYLR